MSRFGSVSAIPIYSSPLPVKFSHWLSACEIIPKQIRTFEREPAFQPKVLKTIMSPMLLALPLVMGDRSA